MNQGLFKLIFNRRSGLLTPTWEGAAACGKASSTARACVLTLTLLFFSHSVLANPSGATVINGNVSFDNNGNTYTITNSPNAIINWKSFSINKGEITKFIQEHGASAILNRVVGEAGSRIPPSEILGSLQSNGRVFIINPNGIVFGQGAMIDVAGLVASTLKLSDSDFLSGKYNFTDGTGAGAIKNQGSINSATGGQVYLIAPDIENSGIITSPKGEIVLAAGHSVSLVDPKNPQIVVSLTAPATQAVNVGQLISAGGSIGIYAGLVNQAGTINANSASIDTSGRIFLKGTQSTTLTTGSVTTASNSVGKGGDIVATAPEVSVEANVSVDASGQTGGGSILIGGDVQGNNPDIANAKNTRVAAGATLKADAIGNGDGGKVVVWADKATRYAGHISARGGEQGGNGGFVEVSGKRYLDFKGTVDTRAPQGRQGRLLLDPTDINIVAIGTAAPDTLLTGQLFEDTAAILTSEITIAALTAALSTNDVTISTNNTNPGATAAGNINWLSGANLNYNGLGTKTLTLNANNNITVSGNITDSVPGNDVFNLTLNPGASGSTTIASTLSLNGGTLTLGSATTGALVSGGTITNAQVSTTGGTGLRFTSASNILDGVTLRGTLDLSSSNARARIFNGLTLLTEAGTSPGVANVTGSGADLLFQGTQTFNNATINLGSATTAGNLGNDGTSTLTLGSGVTVQGRGMHGAAR